MAETFQSILIGGVAGIVSALVTYFSTRAKIRLDLAAEYDKQLREQRLSAYKELWLILEPMARFGREKEITYDDIRDVSSRTRKWYFQTGGIYLTQNSRGPYFAWKKAMQALLDDQTLAQDSARKIDDDLTAGVIAAGSQLRTSLSDDIGTKRSSFI